MQKMIVGDRMRERFSCCYITTLRDHALVHTSCKSQRIAHCMAPRKHNVAHICSFFFHLELQSRCMLCSHKFCIHLDRCLNQRLCTHHFVADGIAERVYRAWHERYYEMGAQNIRTRFWHCVAEPRLWYLKYSGRWSFSKLCVLAQ